jgi:uracil-DNA glycosylase
MPAENRNGNARRAVRQKLESLERSGVTHLPKRKKAASPSTAKASSLATPVPKPASTPIAPLSPPVTAKSPATGKQAGASRAPSRLVQLDIIRQEVASCTRCKPLAAARTQTVFGVGNPNPRLCFVGEAPGADEDRLGEPFVGRAGQLLTKIIEACTLKREDVYILNVLKCRPPENRTPLPDEVANCRGYLDRQLAILQPEYICCLGGTAAQTLLSSDQSIGKLRGTFHEYNGIPVLCTYHPSYLLRNPSAKREVWEDMKVLMNKLGIELS